MQRVQREHPRQCTTNFRLLPRINRWSVLNKKSSKVVKIFIFKSGAAQGRAVTAGESESQRGTLQVSRQHSSTNQTVGTACIAQAAAVRVRAEASRLAPSRSTVVLSNLLP
jgi:hypothetical protein